MKEFRIEAGLTQEELGQRLGVTGVYIAQIENGSRDTPQTFIEYLKFGCKKKIIEIQED